MKLTEIAVNGQSGKSTIFCGDVLEEELFPLRESLLCGGGFLFTDSNVYALYREMFEKQLNGVPFFVMEAGEAHKNEETLFALLHAMAQAELRRNSVLVAIGGGVVGDVGGLAASLYMRGIACIQVPTTLLAQVDSSVGGKTAIDFHGVKNLVGAFHSPVKVLADPRFFATLPARELRCGLGEIVKHGALFPPLFEKLYARRGELSERGTLAALVPENIAFKASVVRQDPTETGVRKCLNLGHTTAHVLEPCGTLSHGECVLCGLLFEGEIARRKFSADGAFCDRLEELCRLGLGGMPALPDLAASARLALSDKKNRTAGKVTLTLPTGAGNYRIAELPIGEYTRLLCEIGEELC